MEPAAATQSVLSYAPYLCKILQVPLNWDSATSANKQLTQYITQKTIMTIIWDLLGTYAWYASSSPMLSSWPSHNHWTLLWWSHFIRKIGISILSKPHAWFMPLSSLSLLTTIKIPRKWIIPFERHWFWLCTFRRDVMESVGLPFSRCLINDTYKAWVLL